MHSINYTKKTGAALVRTITSYIIMGNQSMRNSVFCIHYDGNEIKLLQFSDSRTLTSIRGLKNDKSFIHSSRSMFGSLFLSFKLRLTLQLYFENDLLLLFSILQVQLTYFN